MDEELQGVPRVAPVWPGELRDVQAAVVVMMGLMQALLELVVGLLLPLVLLEALTQLVPVLVELSPWLAFLVPT